MKKRGEKWGEIWPFFGKKSGEIFFFFQSQNKKLFFLGMENFGFEISFLHRIWECIAQFK
jgi:hypothetical protein